MSLLGSRWRSLFGGGFAHVDASARMDRIAPWLCIGPALPLHRYAALRAEGVTHVVDLREEGSDDPAAMASLGFSWRRYAVCDREPPTHRQLAEVIAWLDGEVDQTLLVHCRAGLTRAPTLAMALLLHRGLTLAEAQRLVFAARPEVAPTAAQMAWLGEVEARLRAGGARP